MEYSNLKLIMFQHNVTIEKISEILSLHRNTVANKLNGDSSFSIDEAFKIKNQVFPSYDLSYLFYRIEPQRTA